MGRAIRSFCAECFGNQPAEVLYCTDECCWLYEYRMSRKRLGLPPTRKGGGGNPAWKKEHPNAHHGQAGGGQGAGA